MQLPREITSHPDYQKGNPKNQLVLLDDDFNEYTISVYEYFNGWEIVRDGRTIKSFYLDVKGF